MYSKISNWLSWIPTQSILVNSDLLLVITILYTITLLLYIRKKENQFSTKVSDKMLQYKELFSVPEFYRTIQEAKNGAFPSSLIAPYIDKENGLPR